MINKVLLSAVAAGLLIATPALSMNKGELVDAIAKDANLSKADAKRALEGFISTTSTALKKGDKVALIGFGTFSASVGAVTDPSDPTALLAGKPLKKPIKVRGRNGNKRAATLALGPSGTWELVFGIPDASFYDETVELEIKMPKPVDPRVVELSLDLPSNSPGSNIREVLDQAAASGSGVVIEITLPSNAFDDISFDPANPDPDFHAAFFPSVHADAAVDPCVAAVVADRLGFDGEPVCAAGTSCALDPGSRDQLIASMSASSGLDAASTTAALDAIAALVYPPPLAGARSLSGFGSFAISNRAARTGRNPQTGATIKIKAKKVAKFKAGAALAGAVN